MLGFRAAAILAQSWRGRCSGGVPRSCVKRHVGVVCVCIVVPTSGWRCARPLPVLRRQPTSLPLMVGAHPHGPVDFFKTAPPFVAHTAGGAGEKFKCTFLPQLEPRTPTSAGRRPSLTGAAESPPGSLRMRPNTGYGLGQEQERAAKPLSPQPAAMKTLGSSAKFARGDSREILRRGAGQPSDSEFARRRSGLGEFAKVSAAASAGVAMVGANRMSVGALLDGEGAPPRRRTMAAIAGGGFRGPQALQPRQCMCDLLRAKLARAQAELRELRLQRSMTSPSFSEESVDGGEDLGIAPPLVLRCDTEVQTVAEPDPPAWLPPRTAEASSQVVPEQRHATTQSGVGLSGTRDTATGSDLVAREASSQTSPAAPPSRPVSRDAGAQASLEARSVAEASTQWEGALVESATQVGAAAEAVTVASQTPPRPGAADAAAQASSGEAREHGTQTEPSAEPRRALRAMGSQATPLGKSAGVQATPGGMDRSVQCEDLAMKDLAEEMRRLKAENESLGAEALQLQHGLRRTREGEEAWRHMAQSTALGRLSITILCPRAECTVNGERVEMDSWNPTKLKREFESEVLPRFARVFVEEGRLGSPSQAHVRPEVVERTMQEFADIFRVRLSAMLAAPSATAAVAAAGGAQMRAGRSV